MASEKAQEKLQQMMSKARKGGCNCLQPPSDVTCFHPFFSPFSSLFLPNLQVAAFSKVSRTAKAMMGRFLQSFDLVEVLIIVLPMAGSLGHWLSRCSSMQDIYMIYCSKMMSKVT